MANVAITAGTGTNIATIQVTRDAVPEQIQLLALSDPGGANYVGVDVNGRVGITAAPIGGPFTALPTPNATNPPALTAGPSGVEITCVGGATPGSVTYTIATGAPTSPTLLRQTIAGAANTSSVVDQINLAAGTSCYITASSGTVFYRAI